jgi:hypothetical protein
MFSHYFGALHWRSELNRIAGDIGAPLFGARVCRLKRGATKRAQPSIPRARSLGTDPAVQHGTACLATSSRPLVLGLKSSAADDAAAVVDGSKYVAPAPRVSALSPVPLILRSLPA